MTGPVYDFDERLEFSKSNAGQSVEEILGFIHGAVEVVEASKSLDRVGVDYVVTLDSGVRLYVDLKTRDAGCSQFWSGEPELALETWSVCPGESCLKGKIGWTLDRSKLTHLTLHTFDPTDTLKYYLLPFQHLRMAFYRFGVSWGRCFSKKRQSSGRWTSECVFVPAGEVMDGIRQIMYWDGFVAARKRQVEQAENYKLF